MLSSVIILSLNSTSTKNLTSLLKRMLLKRMLARMLNLGEWNRLFFSAIKFTGQVMFNQANLSNG